MEAEEKLWLRGCLSWDDYKNYGEKIFSKNKHNKIVREIEQARHAYETRIALFFLQRLPLEAKARMVLIDSIKIGYLDIETTGLDERAEITVAALATKNHTSVHYLFRNTNRMREFVIALNSLDLIVSYNGKHFDLPIIKQYAQEPIRTPHLDMKPTLDRQGLRGGQKRAEKIAGLKRKNPELDGKEAAHLWQNFLRQRQNQDLLKLCDYCAEDAVLLQQLTDFSCNTSMTSFPEQISVMKSRQQDITIVGQ